MKIPSKKFKNKKHLNYMRSRNDKEKAERREALLNAAQTAFFTKGFEHTSMDDIASEAGFSRSLLYVYFKDKKAIYQALRIRASQSVRTRMLDYVSQHTLGIDKVRSIAHAFYDFYREEKDYFNCLSLDITLDNQSICKNTSEDSEHSNHGSTSEQETMQVMMDALEQGITDNSLHAEAVGNPLETALFLRGCLHGIILLQDSRGSAMLDTASIDRHKLVMDSIERITQILATPK